MIRSVALLLALALALAQPALAQTAPTAAPNPSPPKPSPTKPSPTKPSPTKPSQTKPTPAKPAAKKPEPPKPDTAAEHGPCGIGVIPHIGETFLLQSFGITVFGNELKKVPIEFLGARRPSRRPRARRCRSTFRGASDGLSGQRVCDV